MWMGVARTGMVFGYLLCWWVYRRLLLLGFGRGFLGVMSWLSSLVVTPLGLVVCGFALSLAFGLGYTFWVFCGGFAGGWSVGVLPVGFWSCVGLI